MRCRNLTNALWAPVLLLLVFPSELLAGFASTSGARAGRVAMIEGHVFAQKGRLQYTRPRVGESVRVNEFGQYDGSHPTPAFVRWNQATRRMLKPADAIEVGDILQTMGDGWVKILFDDDSVLDVGPGAMLEVQKFTQENGGRQIILKTLYGKFRNVVATKKSESPNLYQILTPGILLGVRGTEFLVQVAPDKNNALQTEVVCLHGQVSIDVAKHTTKGVVYHQPLVLNPGSQFSSSGAQGFGQDVNMRALPQDELRRVVARLSPLVNVRATLAGATPPPDRLPGTGLKLRYFASREARKVSRDAYTSTFDMDYPPGQRTIASPSENFRVPGDYASDPSGFGAQVDTRRFTGPAPAAILPATVSRIDVNITGPGL